MILTFKSIDIEESRSPPIMWVGLIQSIEVLKKKRQVPQGRKNSASRLPSTQAATSACCRGLQPDHLLSGFWTAIHHNCMSQLLNVNQFLFLCLSHSHFSHTYTHMHVYTYIICMFCFFGEYWLMQSWERVLHGRHPVFNSLKMELGNCQ